MLRGTLRMKDAIGNADPAILLKSVDHVRGHAGAKRYPMTIGAQPIADDQTVWFIRSD
ncbi:hypothetical protein CHELA1G11_10085 [Hyphomicrobiales bacterium]|nr:hypothetical protein CHELA1G11_10085 [Hyphomicrobiales bacterium]CAH1677191.1 hypothetical protein CHELA1G2_14226 [Hyphomicrobiales bacterium]